METLGYDVLENILFRLPLGAASQAKRVCKSWKTVLDERRHDEVGFLFACHDKTVDKSHLYFGEEYDGNKMNSYYSPETLMEMEHCRFAYEPIYQYEGDILVGSCNGLVCFEKEDPAVYLDVSEPFAICNPLTGEFIFLKANLSRVWNMPKKVANGFGYCQSTKEYKVVRLYTLDGYRSSVQVYTLGSNEWRDIEETSIKRTFASPGIFANGFLLWLDCKGSYITAFDLEDEDFQALPLPPSEAFEPRYLSFDDKLEYPYIDNKLKLLGGNLCLVHRTGSHINIWAYKEINLNTNGYYLGNSWNWFKEFSIESDDHEPFAITKSNQVILLDTYNDFYCYDPKTQSMSKFTQTISKHGDDSGMDDEFESESDDSSTEDDNGMGWNIYYTQVIPHTNSYVSLKDFGETWYGPGCSAVPQTNSYVSLEEVRISYICHRHDMVEDDYCKQCDQLCGHTPLKYYRETWYGPECSAVPRTNNYVSLTEFRDAYNVCHKRIMDPYCQQCCRLCGHK